MNDYVTAVVIDNGSGMCKAGLAGDDAPRSVFATVVGRPKVPGIMVGLDQKEVYVGKEATMKRNVLKIQHPITNGIVTNWDDMEKVWHHTLYNELRVSPEEHPIMMTECNSNPRQNREQLTQIMFEVFSVPKLYLSPQAVCALYASGRSTGVVLDSGDGVTHTVPIYEGFAIPHAIQKLLVAGADLTQFLSQMLMTKGHNFTQAQELEIVKDIKETMCYVVGDYESAIREANIDKAVDKNYELPDGRNISIGSERFKCAEALFKPEMLDRPEGGVHKCCYDSIIKSHNESSVRQDLFSNIVLAGGSTLYEGLSERMQQEMSKLAATVSNKAKVLAPPERLYSVWLGGSILGSLSTFQTMWISKAEYDEYGGAAIIHDKCF